MKTIINQLTGGLAIVSFILAAGLIEGMETITLSGIMAVFGLIGLSGGLVVTYAVMEGFEL